MPINIIRKPDFLRKIQLSYRIGRLFMSENIPVQAIVDDLKVRMDRLQNDMDFVKTHISSYLGNGKGLTYLVDETPIYVNTDDLGPPSNFINGDCYEEEYFSVLASFRKPGSVFLDIGANLGVFSLRMAPMLRHGRIIAFEPNKSIRDLFARSIHLNGLKDQIDLLPYGLSDSDRELTLSVPHGHAGGGSVAEVSQSGHSATIEVRRLDGLEPDLVFDIAKIDVEGHELNVLCGMTNTLRRSADAVILFEKLIKYSGIESDLLSLFKSCGMVVYRIDGMQLTEVGVDEFIDSEAYFLATKPGRVGSELHRDYFYIYPDDMHVVSGSIEDKRLVADISAGDNSLIFHGPYWYLRRGTYNVVLDGNIDGEFRFTVTEKFGYTIGEYVVSNKTRSFTVIAHRNLSHFEIVGRTLSGSIALGLAGIRVTRIG